jgi:hypothetical protein
MNALIEGFPLEWQQQAILKSELTVKYWITSTFYRQQQEKQVDYTLHDSKKAIFGRDAFENSKNTKIPLYKNDRFYKENYELINFAEKILRLRRYQYSKIRKDIFKDDASLRRFVFKEISFWDHILDKYKINVVVLEAMPHTHFSYIIYYLAKLKGIKTMIFHRAADGVLMRFFLAESMDDLTPEHECNDASNAIKIKPNRKSGPPLYSVLVKENPWNQKIYLSTVAKGLLEFFYAPINFFDKLSARKSLFMERLKLSFVGKFYKIEYIWHSTKVIPIKKFIYLPLHVRPEDSSYPVAGDFEDVMYCAEYLLDRLDNDIMLVIKEHPNQRYLDGNMYHGFYRDLTKLNNVVLLDISVKTDDILDKCEFVATTTGQTGWEALLKDKPAVVFSQAWYQNFPYVYHIDDVDIMSLIYKDQEINRAHIDSYYNKYISSTFPGASNLVVAHALGITMKENIHSISCAIDQKLHDWGLADQAFVKE